MSAVLSKSGEKLSKQVSSGLCLSWGYLRQNPEVHIQARKVSDVVTFWCAILHPGQKGD